MLLGVEKFLFVKIPQLTKSLLIVTKERRSLYLRLRGTSQENVNVVSIFMSFAYTNHTFRRYIDIYLLDLFRLLNYFFNFCQ